MGIEDLHTVGEQQVLQKRTKLLYTLKLGVQPSQRASTSTEVISTLSLFHLTHLHVLDMRVGAVLEVGHTHVHGVLGKHLLPLQVGGGRGLEETEKGHVYYTAVAVG